MLSSIFPAIPRAHPRGVGGGGFATAGDNVKGQAVISGQQQPVAEHDLLGQQILRARVCYAGDFPEEWGSVFPIIVIFMEHDSINEC